ncbi:YdcF family protein [Roseimaritima ulvae]|uniref:DUF218 domain-containing protein n=1 Tax=Roseimaritima ulvae TaxID=980254 RepID=A0A5B9QNT8_9BACT|nr:YdcF family protein [Roseimaritima ulvae]QEG38676.1 hypothetical protein UC8_06340 [Roseimaritima ulvae]
MTDDVTRPKRSWKPLLLLLVIGLLLMAGIAMTAGRAVVEKLLTDLAMPMGLLWLTLCWLCLQLAADRSAAFKWAALAWLVCTLAGNGLVADVMLGTLEQRYAEIDPLSGPPLDRVVLLGGATNEAPNGQVQINQNGDRVVLAARMVHLGLASKVLCTGARIKGLSDQGTDEGQAARRILMELGVPTDAIEVIGGRNTSEEMQSIKQLVGTQPVGIITSAWHLDRAMRLAEQEGLQAVPLPSNFNSGSSQTPRPWASVLRDCIPNVSALASNSRITREYLARLVGR